MLLVVIYFVTLTIVFLCAHLCVVVVLCVCGVYLCCDVSCLVDCHVRALESVFLNITRMLDNVFMVHHTKHSVVVVICGDESQQELL